MILFDPIVSLSVIHFMREVFNEDLPNTDLFFQKSFKEDLPSLYYVRPFQDFFYHILGITDTSPALEHAEYGLYHHGARKNEWYLSPAVWKAAELYKSLLSN